MIKFKSIKQMEDVESMTGISLTHLLTKIFKHEDGDGNYILSSNKYGFDFWGTHKKVGIWRVKYSSKNGDITIGSVDVELD